MIRCIRLSVIGLVALLFSPSVLAGVTTVQQLNFGEFIVKNNNAVHSITVNLSGPAYAYDSAGFILINDANIQYGIYDLDGMTPSTAIASVTVTQVTPLSGAGGPNFQMNTFQESHPATTDGSGVARINVGATAQTSGTGTTYLDQTYTGTLQIQINF
jgi:hypothetical protein